MHRDALPPFPHEERFAGWLERTAALAVAPTGAGATLYLDMAERIVREAARWVDADGRVIDPEAGQVHAHSSPRYAAAVGPLLLRGRCEDLLDSCLRCVDVCVRDLAAGNGSAHDFWARDVVLAISCVRDRVEPSRLDEWRRLLGSYDPRERYTHVTSKRRPEDIHNLAIYACTGEQMKRAIGAADETAFIEEHLATQRGRFTGLGMYRDPNCPATYDLTVRQCLGLLLSWGYEGEHRDFVDEVLRRGGLTQLYLQSTTGEAPFGGRSNQFHHMEGMMCWNAEYEASRYRRLGNLRMAGAFKRSARRAAQAAARWVLRSGPPTHIKSGFPRPLLHGCDSYGYVTGYILLAADLFASAALVADESIEERAAPCDGADYVLPILEDFHRIFASCGPLHLGIDTRAQPGFDATGCCRLHHRARPTEIGLSVGIPREPGYRTAGIPFERSVAIGGGWRTADGGLRFLADALPDAASVEDVRESAGRVAFRLRYAVDGRDVVEGYDLTPEALTLTLSVGAGPIAVSVPLLLTDGEAVAEITGSSSGWSVSYRGARFRVEGVDPETASRRLCVRAPNRNGVYDVALFERASGPLTLRLSFPETGSV